MHRLIYLILISVIISGCRTSLQSNWDNFNAYYNTFYNARQSYKTGLKKNLDQNRQYNPLQPIRVHVEPVNAGSQDFQKAINKGADILREHDDSKWVDDALALIGKSFYFRKEYFSADQKFKELYTTTESNRMRQNSVIWQGRVLLDMELYNEGIAFLNEQLAEFEDEWDKRKKAEVKTILAQHYVKQESWELARQELEKALPNLKQKSYKERGYFLLAQVYEKLDDPQGAYDAYDKVNDYYTEYRIQYLANRKKAEVARALGKNNVAYALFSDMVRDDKNTEYNAELKYELGRTDQIRKNYGSAEKIFKQLLHDKLNKPDVKTAALAYYRLAEIYRFQYNDFEMAAAYYDSAAQKQVPAEELPEDFEAKELANSFGEYKRLKNEVALQDSLLWLGQLPPQKFDSVITELRKKKQAELEALIREQESRQNTIVNVSQEEEDRSNAQTGRNGFLNSRNLVMQQDLKRQFYAIWGDRPLVDNWRVNSLIQQTIAESDTDSAAAPGRRNVVVSSEDGGQQIEIDLSQVPFTQTAQDSLEKVISTYYYELGNLFFLSLNLPDSATYYFQKAVENPAHDNINAVSLYSLSEIESINGDEQKSRKYAEQLIEKFPFSKYADRLSDKFDIERDFSMQSASVDTMQIYETIMSVDTVSLMEQAERLKDFSDEYSESRLAPRALYEAIQLYMKKGREDSAYSNKLDRWIKVNSEWNEKVTSLGELQDSAVIALKDTSLSADQREHYQAIVDSTLSRPDFTDAFPYEGGSWDSARSAINQYLETYNNTKFDAAVSRLNKELSPPEKEEVEQEFVPEDVAEPRIEEGYVSCSEAGATLKIRGGATRFINRQLDIVEEVQLREITYRFKVNQRGIIDGYELVTENVDQNIREAFDKAISSGLSFEPVMSEGQAISVQCNYTFNLPGRN